MERSKLQVVQRLDGPAIAAISGHEKLGKRGAVTNAIAKPCNLGVLRGGLIEPSDGFVERAAG